ncbi:MAG TPA: ATP-binding protein [Gaiellaceae bacterium]
MSAAVLLAAGVLALWAVDVVRQDELGVADAGLAFYAVASVVSVAVAFAVARRPGRARLALVILGWLFVSSLDDLSVDWPTSRSATTVWMLAHGLQPAAYGLMVLAYPSGRIRERSDSLLVAAATALGLAWMGVPLLFFRPNGCAACAPRVSSLLYTGTTFDYDFLGKAFAAAFIALGVAFIAILVRRLRSAPAGARATYLPLGFAVVFAAGEFIAQRVVSLGGWSAPFGVLDWLDRANALVLPLAIFVGLIEIRRRRGPLGDLLMELGTARSGEVRLALARTLGDPSLELALWLPERNAFVREDGTPIDVHALGERRTVTTIGPAADPLAALIHDERLLGQRALLEAAGSAAHLALENARLQAELRAQLAELGASRSRIVAAGDAERRRLERDLHDGAQQRLLALGLALQLLREREGDPALLEQAEAELQHALRELRDLARGIHPTILTEQGLGAAVQSLADRAPIAVSVRAGDGRYRSSVETAVYFLVAEALANVVKHARARAATVSLERRDGRLIVDVRDDGRGGATAAAAGGLEGLADRVAAVGGTLTITSELGAGTTLHAEIPCDS